MEVNKYLQNWLLVLVTFWSAYITDAVHPGRSRYSSMSKARWVSPSSDLQSLLTPKVKPALYSISAKDVQFSPTNTRCCKLGEKTGKKSMTCRSVAYSTGRNHGFSNKQKLGLSKKIAKDVPEGYLVSLAYKINKCKAYGFRKNFEKCCNYREQFRKEFKACRKLAAGRDRRKCRKEVRRRFP